MKTAFLSHPSANSVEANILVAALEARGVKCWIAPRDVPPGSHYGEEIVAAIREAEAFIILVSADSSRSSHVLRELELAVNQRKNIIPLRFDDAPLSDSLTYHLTAVQWVTTDRAALRADSDRIADQIICGQGGPVAGRSVNRTPTKSRPPIAWVWIVVAALLLAGVGVWFALHRQQVPSSAPTPVATPTTAPAVTPKPALKPVPTPRTPRLAPTPTPTPTPASTPQAYAGNVGKWEAKYELRTNADGSLIGVYYYPDHEPDKKYVLRGSYASAEVMVLDEYTDGIVSAHVTLNKRQNANSVSWEGTMHNIDGKSYPVIMRQN